MQIILKKQNHILLRNLKKFINNNFKLFLLIFLISTPSYALQKTTKSLISNSPKEVIDEVWQIVFRDFLDSYGFYDKEKWISIRQKFLSNTYTNNEESYEAIRLMLSELKDPYTRFLTPKEFNEMRIDTSGELTGVGIQITIDNETDQILVVSPIEGSPAFRAGIKSKDIITSIDGEQTKGMSIENVVKLIRGERSTEVELEIKRDNKIILFNLLRDRIEISSINSRLNETKSGLKIGYIRLKQFNANASKEMRNSIINLDKSYARGFILDLRSNPGGLLEVSIDIARQWINKGTIVSTLTRDGIKDVRKANGKALTRKPLVILINEGSASASEILSGAIKDNKRGILIGKKTFGKGLVQSVRSLSDGSGLTVTIAKYLTPNGIDINRNGLKPDIEIDVKSNSKINLTYEDLATSRDNQYKAAETELVKLIMNNSSKSEYKFNKSNLESALN